MTAPRSRRTLDWFAPAAAVALTFAGGCWSRTLPTIFLDGGSSSGSGGSLDGGVVMGSGGNSGFGGMTSAGMGGGPGMCSPIVGAGVPSGKLDLLFMIDNSMSMRPLQAKLRAQLPTFLDALVDPATGSLPDLHVAVVSSSLGAGAWANVNGCASMAFNPNSTGDDQGKFRQGRGAPGAGSCSMLHAGARFLSTGNGINPKNFDGDVRAALDCITDLGDDGCGFESQFGSIYWALAKALDPLDPDNGGFLRADAKLAIVMLTNEDDCSVRYDSLLLSPAVNSVSDPTGLGALASYRCNEFGHLCDGLPPPHTASASPVTLNNCVSAENAGKTDPALVDPDGNPDPTQGHLWPTVADFTSYLRCLKPNPNDLLIAAIAGPTTDAMGNSLYQVMGQSNPAAMGELDPVVVHSCVQATSGGSDPEYADPAVRIKQAVDSFGASGIFYPICANNFQSALGAIATRMRSTASTPAGAVP
jgi:hypothetical protein